MRVGALKLKLQFVCGDSYALGPGKADLLEAIDRTGSISGAGRALGMSYRRAWLLVDEMNRCFVARLVETLPGGGRGAGARLSDLGRAVLADYRAIELASETLADTPGYTRLAAALRDAPRPAGPHAD